ncbi:hypothetical protein D9M71_628080 [compost metagenome]|jgi:hypothetical protein
MGEHVRVITLGLMTSSGLILPLLDDNFPSLNAKPVRCCRTDEEFKRQLMFAETLGQNAYRVYRARLEALLQIPTTASNQEIHESIEAGLPARSVSAFYE